MKRISLLITLITIVFLIHSCQKEKSFERETDLAPASGSLQSDASGDCLPKTINGIYVAGTALVPAENYIEIQVDVVTAGSYQIKTDAIQGISFSASGNFTTTGLTTVILKGTGTPAEAGTNIFTVSFGSSTCKVSVPVLPAGGTDPAEIDLKGNPGICDAFVLSGAYATGMVLNSPSNKVVLKVNVKKAGTYNITTAAANGIVFSGSGALTNLGDGTITLTASGTPTASGTVNIPVSLGSATCSFPLTISGAAQYSINCSSAVANGVYQVGVALDASNTIPLDVTVTGTGPYNITGTANGMTFSASGTFSGQGSQTITLTGTGTPVAGGDFSIPLSGGGTITCNVDISVEEGTPATDMNWEFKQGSNVYSGPMNGGVIANIGTFEGMSINGPSTGGGESLVIALSKQGGLTTGDYSTKSLTGNSVTLLSITNASTLYSASPTGGDVIIKVTTLDRVNKIIQGTFSGTAKNAAGQNVAVSGHFKADFF